MKVTDKFIEGFVESCYVQGLHEKQASVLLQYYLEDGNGEIMEKSAAVKSILKILAILLGVGGLGYGMEQLGTTNTAIGRWLKDNLGAGNWGLKKTVDRAIGFAKGENSLFPEDKTPKPNEPVPTTIPKPKPVPLVAPYAGAPMEEWRLGPVPKSVPHKPTPTYWEKIKARTRRGLKDMSDTVSDTFDLLPWVDGKNDVGLNTTTKKSPTTDNQTPSNPT